jgi:hypothetical protein
MTGIGMLEARLLVQLGDHVHAHRGLGRLGAKRVQESEVAMGIAKVQDLPHAAVGHLQESVRAWIGGADPAPAALCAFWEGRVDRVRFSPCGFRLHLGAPSVYTEPDPNAFHLAPRSPYFRRDGDVEALRVSRTGFPEDVVVWWDGREDPSSVVDLVQPGCTLTVVRPRRSWWTSWADVSVVSADRVAAAVYGRFKMTKVHVGDDQDFEEIIMGVEEAKAKSL